MPKLDSAKSQKRSKLKAPQNEGNKNLKHSKCNVFKLQERKFKAPQFESIEVWKRFKFIALQIGGAGNFKAIQNLKYPKFIALKLEERKLKAPELYSAKIQKTLKFKAFKVEERKFKAPEFESAEVWSAENLQRSKLEMLKILKRQKI